MKFRQIKKDIKKVKVEQSLFSLSLPATYESNAPDGYVSAIYNFIKNKITLKLILFNDHKISLLIHELAHAAMFDSISKGTWSNLTIAARKSLSTDLELDKEVNVHKEEMIAYMTELLLGKRIGLESKYGNNAANQFNWHRVQYANVRGKDITFDEMKEIINESENRIDYINWNFYDFSVDCI